MAIITAADYNAFVGTSLSTATSAQLSLTIAAVQAEIERYTGRNFTSATFTEYLDGRDSPTLFVSNPPIASVTSLALVDQGGTATYTFASTEYTFDTGELGKITLAGGLDSYFYSTSGSVGPGTVESASITTDAFPDGLVGMSGPIFPAGTRNVKVVYAGAYSSAPADLQLAMYRLVGMQLAIMGDDFSKQSENLGEYGYANGGNGTGLASAVADAVANLAAPFKRYG